VGGRGWDIILLGFCLVTLANLTIFFAYVLRQKKGFVFFYGKSAMRGFFVFLICGGGVKEEVKISFLSSR